MSSSKTLEVIYQVICASFCVIVVMSNILSAKMVILPILEIYIPAGLITYPLTFLLSDLVTEIFGVQKAKLMVYIALFMNFLSFCMIEIALLLPDSNFNAHLAFQAVLGLSGLRIFSSLVSYIISQLVGIQLYAVIKHWTGPNFLWIRNNVSTLISQIIDTILIDLIFLWWGLGMTFTQVLPIMLFSYTYKVMFSAASTPLFYLFVFFINKEKLKTVGQLKLYSFNNLN